MSHGTDADVPDDASETGTGSGSVQLEEWDCFALDSFQIRLVRSSEDMEDESRTFHPRYLHQIWQDEVIYGYKGLRIDLTYNAATLESYLQVNYAARVSDEDSTSEVEDIISKLTEQNIGFLYGRDAPPVIGPRATNLDDFIRHLDAPFTPPGEKVHAFVDSCDRHLEVYQGSTANPAVLNLTMSTQTLSLLLIDGANFIDLDDDRWILFVIYEVQNPASENPQYHFVGATTVYRFYGYPDRCRYRISQFFILPPFQRRGYGEQLIRSVYKMGISDPQCIDINVEDPNPDFDRMRTLAELRMCEEDQVFQTGAKSLEIEADPGIPFPRWTKALGDYVTKTLKINSRHARICWEVLKLKAVQNLGQEGFRSYRLDVKRRLYNSYQNVPDDDGEIRQLHDDERKDKLQEAFEYIHEENLYFVGKL